MRNLIFLVRGPPKKWGFSILIKKPKIYDNLLKNQCKSYRRLQVLKSIFENHLFLNFTRSSFFLNFARFSLINHAFIICKSFINNIIQYALQDMNDLKI